MCPRWLRLLFLEVGASLALAAAVQRQRSVRTHEESWHSALLRERFPWVFGNVSSPLHRHASNSAAASHDDDGAAWSQQLGHHSVTSGGDVSSYNGVQLPMGGTTPLPMASIIRKIWNHQLYDVSSFNEVQLPMGGTTPLPMASIIRKEPRREKASAASRRSMNAASPTAVVILDSGGISRADQSERYPLLDPRPGLHPGLGIEPVVSLAQAAQTPTVDPLAPTLAPVAAPTLPPATVAPVAGATVAPVAGATVAPVAGATVAPVAPVVTVAPVAAATPAAAAPATDDGGGMGFGMLFFILLLLGLLGGLVALFMKWRASKQATGRLGGLGADEDMQFWKSAKSRQSYRKSATQGGTGLESGSEIDTGSTNVSGAKKDEGQSNSASISAASYRDRRGKDSKTMAGTRSLPLEGEGVDDEEAEVDKNVAGSSSAPSSYRVRRQLSKGPGERQGRGTGGAKKPSGLEGPGGGSGSLDV